MTAESLLPILGRLWTLFPRLAFRDGSFAGIAGELEVLGQFQRIHGTGVLAEPTEHATAQVVGKVGEFLAAGLLVACARDHDEVLRTGERAQIAGNAHGLVGIGIHIQPRRAAIALGYLRPLQRILLGINLPWILVAKRDLQAL